MFERTWTRKQMFGAINNAVKKLDPRDGRVRDADAGFAARSDYCLPNG